MDYEYSGVGFLFHAGLFLLAGVVGRYKVWLGILLATLITPSANLLIGGNLFDVLAGIPTGFLAGLCGAIIIPLFWAGRHGTASCGLRFLNIGAMSRNTLHFNWIKDDNHPDNQSNRKPWTEKK